MDDRVLSALIGAIVVALGWFFNARRDAARREAARRQRQVDVQKALRAEIRAIVEAPQNADLEGSLARGLARFDDEDVNSPYVPLIPHEKHDTIYQALVGEIYVLPADAIEPVVRYYNQTVSIALMATDMRSDGFTGAGVARRRKMLRDYMVMKIEAKRLGLAAIAALDATIGDGG
ncbi:MAG: hypothetical protein AAGE76_13010 [Pseudomonadota bacterium]